YWMKKGRTSARPFLPYFLSSHTMGFQSIAAANQLKASAQCLQTSGCAGSLPTVSLKLQQRAHFSPSAWLTVTESSGTSSPANSPFPLFDTSICETINTSTNSPSTDLTKSYSSPSQNNCTFASRDAPITLFLRASSNA